MAITPGLRASVRIVVGEDDTAPAVGSGDVPVLATPRLLAVFENATLAAVHANLEPGATTVGTSVAMLHRVASPVGAEVVATASLTAVDGRRLTFEVEARANGEVIATGRVERVVVDRERFMSRLG